MRITQLTLCDYIRFRVSKIQEISIDIDQDVQLIIGSNGSGKSSILHELFPYPPIKSSFGKNGFKSLTVLHEGVEYKLVYDVNTGHRFIRDGINLNVSGTNEIQKELIYDHFGLDNDIHTILKCSLAICDMVPSARKKILMNLNPIDISLFLDRYQKVHKDAIAYGNNLERLFARQKELISKKIPEQQYQDMLKRKEILDNQEKILLMWITAVTTEIGNIGSFENITYNDPSYRIKELLTSLESFRHIKRDTLSSKITEANVKLDIYAQELKGIEADIEKTILLINEYESKKVLLENDVHAVTHELKELKERIVTYVFNDGFIPIGKNDIDTINHLSTRIMDILVHITYIEYKKILSMDEVQQLRSTIMTKKFELTNIRSTLKQLHERRDELLKTIKMYSIAPHCDGRDCELFTIYNEHQLSKKSILDEVSIKIDQCTITCDNWQSSYEEMVARYDTQILIWNNLNEIFSVLNESVYLRNRFSKEYVISKINESPMLIYNEIIQYIKQSESYHEYITIREKIHKLELINAAIISKQQTSLESMESDIVKTKSILDDKRSDSKRKSDTIKQTKIVLDELNVFKNKRNEVQELLNSITDIETNMVISLSHQYLNNLLNVLSTLLTEIRSESIDLTNICKEQELLLARLDTEIDAVIQNIQPKYEKAKAIEKSLAELPVKYTKNFINAIIETTNYFINEIMTYSMKLIPVDSHEECTFQFPVIINDEVPTKDISLCSDGQKAIIQLAFNLAIAVELRFNNYPLFCDEYDRALDSMHSQRLTDMLMNLMRSKIATQLFVVNHDKSMIEQLSHTGDVIVLNAKNIDLPEKYNENVKIINI